MRIIAKRTLRAFWQRHPNAKGALAAWQQEVSAASWDGPHEVKQQFRHASILKDSRVVINIAGNKYRLVVKMNYYYQVAYVRFVGTHAEYDQIDAGNI